MKRFLLSAALTIVSVNSAFAQFNADDRSTVTSSPAPAFGVASENEGVYTDVRNQPSPALFTATNVLHQGTSSITITYTPAARASWGPNPLFNEPAPMIFLGMRVYKDGANLANATAGTVQAPANGNLDWGGNNDHKAPNAALALTRVGTSSSFRTPAFNPRTIMGVNLTGKTIARMMIIVKMPGDWPELRPCSNSMGCQQTDNREFTFAPTVITGTSVRDAAEYVESASSTPNPMSDMMLINFTLKKPTPVTARIFDAMGREVRTIMRGQTFGSGACAIQWDGVSNEGVEVAAGMYFFRLEVDGGIRTGKFTVVR
ncbi:MAG: T9SS C-terminal target domain-containing protein [Candidatus Kapaibacterium sp.]|nr:MAG: T9SS C-terminal target domain-containing protein [Candidatus Kapabacteria bacterium]